MDTLAAGSLAPTVYRIYTEDKPVVGIIARYFEGYTLFHGTGVYKSQLESSVVIEIVDAFQYRDKVVRLAAEIADANRQAEVLVTWQSSHGFERVRVFGK